MVMTRAEKARAQMSLKDAVAEQLKQRPFVMPKSAHYDSIRHLTDAVARTRRRARERAPHGDGL
jgi:hypothetical protein